MLEYFYEITSLRQFENDETNYSLYHTNIHENWNIPEENRTFTNLFTYHQYQIFRNIFNCCGQ